MDKLSKVWVMGEDPESFRALCAVGRRLGDRVEAIWVGGKGAEKISEKGTDAVLVVPHQEELLFEDHLGSIIAAVKEHCPDVILLSTSKRTRLAAAQLAAACATRVVNDATHVSINEGHLLAKHIVFGGGAYSTEKVCGAPAIVLLSDGLLLNEPVEQGVDTKAEIVELVYRAVSSGLKLIERKPREVESVNLTAAKRVVSIGRGLENKEDLQLISDLAQVLEAEVGCTRPISEGNNWMSRERYIGVSGSMLKPDLFVAVGLSGQIQHMVGAMSAKTIIAINKDKNAPVFKQVDYGIVGDLYEVVPKLIAGLKA